MYVQTTESLLTMFRWSFVREDEGMRLQPGDDGPVLMSGLLVGLDFCPAGLTAHEM